MVATGGQVIEVHHCYYPGGLLGGLGAWRGGSVGISKRGCGIGWSCFISFHFLYVEAAAGNHAIEVHHCCYPSGLLGSPCVGRGGLGGISKGGCAFGLSCMISFPCLLVKATTSDHPIEVHYCYCPGGLLGGIGAGGRFVWPLYDKICVVGRPLFISFLFLRIEATTGDGEIEVHHCCCSGGFLGGLGVGQGGLWLSYNTKVAWLVVLHLFPLHRGCHRRSGDRSPPLPLSGWTPRWPRRGAWRPLEAFLREWVSDHSFSCWLGCGCKLQSGLGALWLGRSAHLFAMSLASCVCFLLGMQEVQGIKVFHDILTSL